MCIRDRFEALFSLLNSQSSHRDAAALCAKVLAAREEYSAGQLAGEIGVYFYLVFERLATPSLMLKQDVYKRQALDWAEIFN